ncbi:hypothetical protein [Gallaecimonas xiamenensis]|uniref:hypothetical protein n=1 Tax=Gallaecimonas xiamenensis TaxID=1207039 RepID=UPI0012EA1434|nr:hypothetical protein [Gallaecimonas xiamenensis]
MDRVINEESWNYVLFERDSQMYVTYLVQYGPATVDFTIKLNAPEISDISSGKRTISSLIEHFKNSGANCESRFIKPPLWPNK